MNEKIMVEMLEDRYPDLFEKTIGEHDWLIFTKLDGTKEPGKVYLCFEKRLAFRFQHIALTTNLKYLNTKYTEETKKFQILKNKTISRQALAAGVRIIDVLEATTRDQFKIILEVVSDCPFVANFVPKQNNLKSNERYLHEAECRKILEELFPGHAFPSCITMEWLKNPKTGKYMELDCYNKQLELALEYQGEQHYKVGKFCKTLTKLEEYQARDLHKLEACFKNGVRLIVVPYTIKFEDLEGYIQLQIQELR